MDQTESSRKKKLDPFPVILHRMLCDPGVADTIIWAPHGCAWRVLNKTKLLNDVTPKFFNLKHYKSFLRQVTGWGFVRITKGKDKGCYYHKVSFNYVTAISVIHLKCV